MKISVEPFEDSGDIKWIAVIEDGTLQSIGISREEAILFLKAKYLAFQAAKERQAAQAARDAELKSKKEILDVKW